MMREPNKNRSASIGASWRSDAGDVIDAIEDLRSLDADNLAKRWRTLVGGAIPNDLGRPLALRILAYKLQAQRFGDLDKASGRELSAIYYRPEAPIDRASDMAADEPTGPSFPIKSASRLVRHARPGTLLTREHGGATHRVMVTDEGVVWNGRTFDSLSKVAFAITGTRWKPPKPTSRAKRMRAGACGAITMTMGASRAVAWTVPHYGDCWPMLRSVGSTSSSSIRSID
jgi:hypothetical protein